MKFAGKWNKILTRSYIFLRSTEAEAAKIYSEAEEKISDVQQTKWHDVAKELQNEDPYQFIRAYSAGNIKIHSKMI